MAIEVPFVGLSPFDARYRDYFFGRRSDSTILAANALSSRICVVFGRSGVGKTSVMQAGVPPALDDFEPATYLCLRAWQDDPHGAFLTLLREAAGAAGVTVGPEASASAIAFDIVRISRKPLVLVFDQFEEFFQGTNAASRARFEVELSTIVSALDRDVHAAISIRDDALYRLDALKGHIPEIMARTIEVGSLSLAAAAETIRGPVAKFNEEHGTGYKVDDDLVDALLSEVVSRPRFHRRTEDGDGEPEQSAIEAPFLQLALKVLWDSMLRRGEKTLSRKLLDDLGGAEEIVSRHLDAVIRSVRGDEAYLAVIFDRLITPEGHKIALSLDEIAGFAAAESGSGELPEAERSRIEALLTKLATGDERILRITEGGRYELFHDILAKPVIEWVREYNQRQRDRKRRRQLVYSFGAIAAVVIVLGAYFVVDRLRYAAIARELAAAAAAELERGNPRGAVLAAEKTLELMPEVLDPTVVGKVQRALWSGLTLLDTNRILSIGAGGGCVKSSLGTANRQGKWQVGEDPRSQDDAIYSVDFSPDSRRVVTGSDDGTARVWDAESGQCLCELEGHADWIRGVAFNPADAAMVATTSFDATARLWNVDTCEEVGRLSQYGADEAPRPIRAVAFSRDGTRIATASYDRKTRVWDTATRQLVALLDRQADPTLAKADWTGHAAIVLAVAFSPVDRNIIATGSYDATARIWDISDATVVKSRPLLGHTKEVYSVAFSPDGSEVATSSRDGSVRVWDAAAGTMLRGPLNAHRFETWRAAYGKNVSFSSKEQPLLVTGGWDRAVRIFLANSFQPLAVLLGHTDQVRDLAVSPDGRWIVSGSSDRTARLWELRHLTGVPPIHHHVQRVTSIATSPKRSDLFATGSIDGVVRIWQMLESCSDQPLTDGFALPEAVLRPSPGYAAAAPRAAETSAAAGESGACAERQFRKDYNSGEVRKVLIDPTGTLLFAAYQCGRVIAWNLETGVRLWVREPDFGGGDCSTDTWLAQALDLAFLGSENQLVIAVQNKVPDKSRVKESKTKLVRVDALTGGLAGEQPGDEAFLFARIAVNPAGTLLAVSEITTESYARGRVRLFALNPDGSPGGATLLDMQGLRPVTRLVFSADGRRLAGAAAGTAVVWDLPSDGEIVPLAAQTFTGHLGDITDVIFDPTGRFLFTTSTDESIRVWNIDTREGVYEYAPQRGAVQAIALTSDDGSILTGGDDATVVAVENLADVARARTKACLNGAGGRRRLDEAEADRLMAGIAAVEGVWQSIDPIVTRDMLLSPIECSLE